MTTEQASLLELGERAFREGRLADAERALRGALDMEPEQVDALHMLAVLRLRQGHARDAERICSQALALAPDRADILTDHALALRGLGRLQEAADAAQNAVRQDADHAEAYRVLGDCLSDAGDWERATSFYAQAVKREPDSFAARFGLGKALFETGRYPEAEAHLGKASAQRPDEPGVAILHGWSLYKTGHLEKCLELFLKWSKTPSVRRQALVFAATAYLDLARPEDAMALLEEAEADGPLGSLALIVKGNALNVLHRREEALLCFRQAVSLTPESPHAWHEMARLAPDSISEGDMAIMEKALQKTGPAGQSQLHFARARVFEARGEWRAELDALHKGNARRGKLVRYDPEAAERNDRQIRELFTGDFLERARAHGDDSVAPLFILGMPRSGTTLTEQILASHSRVEAAGESRALHWAFQQYCSETGEEDAPRAAVRSPESCIPRLASLYRTYLGDMDGVESTVFTDKNIVNYQFAGLLAAMFPRARFIQVERHPMDLCFGCYKQLFAHGQAFTYNLEHCAHALRQFNVMMAHWHEETDIPLFTLRYEDLVRDQETWTRRLLEFAGLEWEDACLHFHENRRAVATVSINQVRQGLNDKAVGRWQRYGEGLAPLREALRKHGIEPDAYPG